MICNGVILGDALEELKKIPDESIDLILTDPPYMISNEIVIARSANYKYKGSDISHDFGDWDKQWKDKWEYIEWCKLWWKECIRILKPCRHLLFFFDKAKVSYAWDFMEENGMQGRAPVFWIKTNPVPRARGVDFAKAVEEILWFTKDKVKKEYFNWQLGHAPDYIFANIPHSPRYHPTQKPEVVMERLILYLSKPGDLVLDPFAGSGTTLVVAKKLGRKYLGIEKEEKYVKICEERLKTTTQSLFTRSRRESPPSQ